MIETKAEQNPRPTLSEFLTAKNKIFFGVGEKISSQSADFDAMLKIAGKTKAKDKAELYMATRTVLDPRLTSINLGPVMTLTKTGKELTLTDEQLDNFRWQALMVRTALVMTEPLPRGRGITPSLFTQLRELAPFYGLTLSLASREVKQKQFQEYFFEHNPEENIKLRSIAGKLNRQAEIAIKLDPQQALIYKDIQDEAQQVINYLDLGPIPWLKPETSPETIIKQPWWFTQGVSLIKDSRNIIEEMENAIPIPVSRNGDQEPPRFSSQQLASIRQHTRNFLNENKRNLSEQELREKVYRVVFNFLSFKHSATEAGILNEQLLDYRDRMFHLLQALLLSEYPTGEQPLLFKQALVLDDFYRICLLDSGGQGMGEYIASMDHSQKADLLRIAEALLDPNLSVGQFHGPQIYGHFKGIAALTEKLLREKI